MEREREKDHVGKLKALKIYALGQIVKPLNAVFPNCIWPHFSFYLKSHRTGDSMKHSSEHWVRVMRKKERAPIFDPNESWGADLIPVRVHHVHLSHPSIHPHLSPHLPKNRNGNFSPLISTPFILHTCIPLRDHTTMLRDGPYIPPSNPAHAEEKHFIPSDSPHFSGLCLYVFVCFCVQGFWREHAKCKL